MISFAGPILAADPVCPSVCCVACRPDTLHHTPQLVAAWKRELAEFTREHLVSPPLLPGEACEGCTIAICCDGNPLVAPSPGKLPTCDCNGKPH